MNLWWLRILEIEYECDTLLHDLIHQTDVTYMFSDCPNLEHLVIVNYPCERVHISSPKLENLELSSCYSLWHLRFLQVELLAPSLKSVGFSNILPTVILVGMIQLCKSWRRTSLSCLNCFIMQVISHYFCRQWMYLILPLFFPSFLWISFSTLSLLTSCLFVYKVLLSVPSSLSDVSFCNLRYVKLNSFEYPNLEKLEVDLNQVILLFCKITENSIASNVYVLV